MLMQAQNMEIFAFSCTYLPKDSRNTSPLPSPRCSHAYQTWMLGYAVDQASPFFTLIFRMKRPEGSKRKLDWYICNRLAGKLMYSWATGIYVAE